ncbi:MAG TPA: hypothetical protein VGS79_23310 [Puia sp.]|nr:hypothetical protein [Puia sp.]
MKNRLAIAWLILLSGGIAFIFYNRSRYCTDERTSFARQALDGLQQGNYSLIFSPLALKAYGCQLPECTR